MVGAVAVVMGDSVGGGLPGFAAPTASAVAAVAATGSATTAAAAVPMPPELTGSEVVGAWAWNGFVVAALLVVGAVYSAGAVRYRRRTGERWPVNRTVAFWLGLAAFAGLTMSFLGVYQQVLFWVRAVQIVTLLMVVPFLLALGSPVRLAVEAGPRWLASVVTAALGSRTARVLTFPAVVSIAFLATPFVVYFSPLYETTLRSRGAAWGLSLALVAVGFLYYWTRLRLDPVPKAYPHLVSVGITFAEAIADGALGLTLMLGHHLVAGDYYTALGRPWGVSLRQDQVWGGGALWLIGDLAGVPFIGALWRRMFREDQEQAAEVDAELDAAMALRAVAVGTASGAGSGAGSAGVADSAGPEAADEETQRSRPWWETDPRFAERYGFAEPE